MKPTDVTYMKFYKALKYICEKEGYGIQTEIAHKSNVSVGFINQILQFEGKGKRAGFNTQVDIASAVGYKYEEFLTLGQKLLNGEPTEEKPFLQAHSHSPIVDVIDGFEKINLEEHADHYRGIPLYESGKLAPGAGGYSFDEKPTSTMVVYQPEIQDRIKHDLRALRVKGDSMWPRIPEGAIVIVDLNDREFVDRQIYVVRDPNSEPPTATVRRICKADQKHFKGLALVSEHPEYLPEMTNLDWHELVVGRAVWMWRNLENV